MSQDEATRAQPAPWFRMHPRGAIVVAAVLFVAVVAVRLTSNDSSDAITVMFSLPVALLAVAFGVRGGLIGAAIGYGLFAIMASWHSNGDLDLLGWFARAASLFPLGLLLGRAADQIARSGRLALAEQLRRLELEESERRQLEALELNDSVIQQIAAAKWLIERGESDEAIEVLTATIETGQRLVAGLLPRSITRLRAVERDDSGGAAAGGRAR